MKRPVDVKIWNGGHIVENFQMSSFEMRSKDQGKSKTKFDFKGDVKVALATEKSEANIEIANPPQDYDSPRRIANVEAKHTLVNLKQKSSASKPKRAKKCFKGCCDHVLCCVTMFSAQGNNYYPPDQSSPIEDTMVNNYPPQQNSPIEDNIMKINSHDQSSTIEDPMVNEVMSFGENLIKGESSTKEDISTKEETFAEEKNNLLMKFFKCSSCEYGTDTELNLGKHMTMKHGRPYPLHRCSSCGFETKVKRDLPTHSCTPFKCGLCNFESRSKQLMNQHKVNLHKTKSGLVFCDICSYRSNRISNVESHRKTVHEGQRIVCQYCAKKFTQQSEFVRHLAKAHNEVLPMRPYPRPRETKCDNCGYETVYMSTFVKHKCEPLKCESCDFEAKNEVFMRRHKVGVHLKKGGFFCCDECAYKDKSHYNLKKHVNNKHRKGVPK